MEEIIRFPSAVWNFLQNEIADFNPSDKVVAFACFSKRRTHWDIVDAKKLPVVVRNSGRSGGYTYTYPGIKELGYYPVGGPTRFCGTFVVSDELELSLEDAYWMGREQIDFRIKAVKDSSGRSTHKAWAFDRKEDEFYQAEVKVV